MAAGPRYGTWGAATEDMDTKVKPGDSLFDFAEGTWLKNHPIPADKTGAGYNYELPDEIELQVRKMVEAVTADPTTPIAKKIGDAYAAWMDEAGIETQGLAPAKPWLARIDAVSTRAQLVRLMTEPGYAAPINIDIAADQDDPTRYTATAGQARLGLPTRDYYLLKGDKYDSIRSASALRNRGESPIAATSSSSASWRGCPIRKAAPTGFSRSKPGSPRTSGRPSGVAIPSLRTTR
jgi:predicted metalloendopeptidase